MKSQLFPRPRSSRSFRVLIRTEIQRRLASGESLAIRPIIEAVGGGSTDTVREELAAVSESDVAIAASLKGHRLRNETEERLALRSALSEALNREAALRAENDGLRKIVSQTGDTITYLTARHDDAFRMLMTSIDDYRVKMAAADAVCANPPTTVTKEVYVKDPLIEAQYKVKIRELSEAHREINKLHDELKKLLPPPPTHADDPEDESPYE